MSSAFNWDDDKNESNRRKHKIGFEAAERFDFNSAVTMTDSREDYGEHREAAIGFIGDVLYFLAFTRRGDAIRVISLRRANKSERSLYVKETYGR